MNSWPDLQPGPAGRRVAVPDDLGMSGVPAPGSERRSASRHDAASAVNPRYAFPDTAKLAPPFHGFSDPAGSGPETGRPEGGEAVTRDAAVAALVGSTLADVERAFVEATLERHGGAVLPAARMLGISPSTLYRKRATWTGKPARPPRPG